MALSRDECTPVSSTRTLPTSPREHILGTCSRHLQTEQGSVMYHVLRIPLYLRVEIKRIVEKLPKLLEGVLERDGIGHPS